jgi:type I restriction enzyme M protein
MLDNETKRRIDTARDILVGKLPNPQAQVEQITIAMIYKFMDDMDKEAMEMGGEKTFFTGDFEKYSWTKIFDPKLGGFEMLGLYGEAIIKLNQNPNIPQLFRDIFKNAFLPYRDPETLKLFLKVINEFQYDHSEKLGDAFEYLLSVLGSQGDAGQFRTPRHIIDFIVSVIQPKKDESICDPACGTAGFLISAYKHILNENTKKNKGDLLTPDDRKKLLNNFTGYDISAEMVRLSLVNMYLHGFPTPHIYEYDSLTSEDRWGESFDIILANPPFMTPKGGIRPHKKFAMQANRSEVLFVDYIMEHINRTTGRAAVIVPEGIIFQSAGAYKELRKLLVEKNFLYGVVSLPAGIFQPYSGVKTSILLLDKSLAKKTDKILFVKIENDGYSLGAQRKEIRQNDLPDSANFIAKYISAIKNNDFSLIDLETIPSNISIVEKEKIRIGGEYNLSGERLRVQQKKHTHFPIVELGDVIEVLDNKRKPITQSDRKKGIYPYYGATGIVDFIDDFIFDERLVLVGEDGAKWGSGERTAFIAEGKYWVNNHAHVLKLKSSILDTYLVHILNTLDLSIYITGVTVPKLNQAKLREIKIPLPPLSIQQEIVTKIEQYEKIISGAKQIIENYKPQIDINPDWEMVELGKITEVKDGTHDSPQYYENGIPFLTQKNITSGGLSFEDIRFISEEDHKKFYKRSDVGYGDILISMIGANRGMSCMVNDERTFSIKNVGLIKPTEKLHQRFLLNYLKSNNALTYISLVSKGGAQEFISLTSLRQFPIPIPSLEEQKAIVSQIDIEDRLIKSNKELVEIFEQKISAEINKLWEE